MTPVELGLIGFIVLIVLLFSGMPVGLVMALVGFGGFAALKGMDSGLGLLGQTIFRTFNEYNFSVVVLFVLMGEFCFAAGLSKGLYGAAHKWIGQLPGGLAMATVGACAGFAAICGSSVATAVTMATVALPEMKRYKYSDALATGCLSTGGTLGIMIPPSIGFIIYGIITEQSIGELFLAGILPGIMLALFFIIAILIICKINPQMGPPGPRTTAKEKLVSLKGVWMVALLFFVVMGGIYGGIFSPTEAAGIGAFLAFVFALVLRRMTWKSLHESLRSSIKVNAMALTIVAGAMIFGYFLAVSRLPSELAAIVAGFNLNRYVIILIIMVVYLFLGCLMDSLAMILITVPIFFPLVVKTCGFDPIWFGVFTTLMAEIGMVTPPIGLNVFVIHGMAKDVPMYTIFRGVMPFFIAMIFLSLVLIIFPDIALIIPRLMN